MAKGKQHQEVALATSAGGSLVNVSSNLPDYLRDKAWDSGTDDIAAEDVSVPRLKIGQDMSKEVQDGNVERGDLFLNITGETILPAGQALPFVVLAQSKEFILWRPQKDNGGGILTRARPVRTPDGVRYRWDNPGESFNVKVEGKVAVTWKTGEYVDEDGLDQWGSEIPGDKESGIAATAHHNYVIVLPQLGNLICALSLSRTASRKARDFNGMLKIGQGPLQSRLYTVETFDDKSGDNAFKNFKFRPAGYVNEGQYNKYARLAEGFKGKVINVDQSDGGDAPVTDERA